MQRRAASQSTSASGESSTGSHNKSSPALPSRNKKSKRGGGQIGLVRAALLFGAMGLLAMSSWVFFPSAVVQVEEEMVTEAKMLSKKAVEAEHRVQDWFQNEEKSTPLQPNNADAAATNTINLDSNAATAAMMAQDSSWVDGEKKLKEKLKLLAERQGRGLDLGVPVLTRYLGEDFPAWVGSDTGMTVEDWQAQVDKKYAQMRIEEEEWKKRMQAMMDQRERDVGITTAR
jgi:hypothetical protein